MCFVDCVYSRRLNTMPSMVSREIWGTGSLSLYHQSDSCIPILCSCWVLVSAKVLQCPVYDNGVCSNAGAIRNCCDEEETVPEGNALNSPVDLNFNPPLQLWLLVSLYSGFKQLRWASITGWLVHPKALVEELRYPEQKRRSFALKGAPWGHSGVWWGYPQDDSLWIYSRYVLQGGHVHAYPFVLNLTPQEPRGRAGGRGWGEETESDSLCVSMQSSFWKKIKHTIYKC